MMNNEDYKKLIESVGLTRARQLTGKSKKRRLKAKPEKKTKFKKLW